MNSLERKRRKEKNYLENKDEPLKPGTRNQKIIRRLALDDKSFLLCFAHLFLIFAYRSSSWTGYISVVYYFLIPLIYSHRASTENWEELRRQDSQDSHLSSLLISTTHYIPLFLHTNLMTLLLRTVSREPLSRVEESFDKTSRSEIQKLAKHKSKYFLELISRISLCSWWILVSWKWSQRNKIFAYVSTFHTNLCFLWCLKCRSPIILCHK